MAEWLKATVLKTVERESVPWVRIPLPPPLLAGGATKRWRGKLPVGV